MKRNLLFVFSFILIASLLATGTIATQAGVPGQWAQIPFTTGDSSNTGVVAIEVFKGKLFAATQDFAIGMCVWRMEDDQTWTQVTEAGFGVPELSTPQDMISYDGMLYVASGDWWGRTTGQLWRSPTGEIGSWEAVTVDGFGQPELGAINKFAVFNEMLYLGASTPAGLQIWRSATGAPGAWERVVADGMGDPLAMEISSFAVFKGALYAAIQTDWFHPTRIWRTMDGMNWEVVRDNGFGYDQFPPEAFVMDTPGSFAVFQDYLYLGVTTLDFGTVDWGVPENNISPAEIWRTKDGMNWERVVDEGFGVWHNVKPESLYVFEGRLYVATYSYRWTDDVPVPGTGIQVWSSPDGLSWTQINENGFGDYNNWVSHQASDVTAYNGRLYYGTLNNNGGQIWTLTQ